MRGVLLLCLFGGSVACTDAADVQGHQRPAHVHLQLPGNCAPGSVTSNGFKVPHAVLSHEQSVHAPCPNGTSGALVIRCDDGTAGVLEGVCEVPPRAECDVQCADDFEQEASCSWWLLNLGNASLEQATSRLPQGCAEDCLIEVWRRCTTDIDAFLANVVGAYERKREQEPGAADPRSEDDYVIVAEACHARSRTGSPCEGLSLRDDDHFCEWCGVGMFPLLHWISLSMNICPLAPVNFITSVVDKATNDTNTLVVATGEPTEGADVSESCSYPSTSFLTATVMVDSEGLVTGITGPGGELFERMPTNDQDQPHYVEAGVALCEGPAELTETECNGLAGPYLPGAVQTCCEYDIELHKCRYQGGICPDVGASQESDMAQTLMRQGDALAALDPLIKMHGLDPATLANKYLFANRAMSGPEARRVERVFILAVHVNLFVQLFAGFMCYQVGKLWAKCANPLRALVCNPVVWWSRELWLDYECLNPCACDAHVDTLLPVPGCPGCDFAARVPPHPFTSWRAFNAIKGGGGKGAGDFMRCGILPSDDSRVECPPPEGDGAPGVDGQGSEGPGEQ